MEAGGNQSCQTPEFYSIPEWSTLVGTNTCLQGLQNVFALLASSFNSLSQVALGNLLKAHLELGRKLPHATQHPHTGNSTERVGHEHWTGGSPK